MIALQEQGRLQDSARAYMEVLRLQPGHERARKGLEQVKKQLQMASPDAQSSQSGASEGGFRALTLFCAPATQCCEKEP